MRTLVALSFVLLNVWIASGAEFTNRFRIYKSLDQGKRWKASDAGFPGNDRINSFARLNNKYFAATDAGIYVSQNGGEAWKQCEDAPVKDRKITSMAVLSNKVFAASNKGVVTSSDGGDNWELISFDFKFSEPRVVYTLDGRLFLGTNSKGVYRSSDGGLTWEHLIAGLPPHGQIFALDTINGKLFAALYSKGLYYWDESGRQWLKTGSVRPLVLASTDSSLVAGHNPGGIFWSADAGTTWAKATGFSEDDLTLEPHFDKAPVWELAADSQTVLAGADDGVFVSNDHGKSWVRTSQGLPANSPGIAFLLHGRVALAGILLKNP